ncbi:Branched-chain amino acid transport ATP-binding protein LivF [Desulfurella amilsii]|uniref:Branched-chain amino acid transport ATP-binding protein LivF n=1 Tax=Desulfurella amilsii TaxID=1562698 RepID=A0A1X4XY31_9BACT|nr:ATP-binding cassette domain-containing protein [Desulfurella amilsii]OSS42450.1 Branched-chain amino acid transport ATP-binding protein LivF [Desulfurella amilsii]
MALLEVINLEKRFGGIHATDNVSFEVKDHEIVGLIGPNGAGKSTILHLIVGLHKPTSGTIKFESKEIQHLSIHERIKKGISVMFQHSRPLSRQTVLENIELSLLPDKFRVFYPKDIKNKAIEIAKKLGLDLALDKRPNELPFGIVRRMELAKALALNPKLLLLDEPFAGLSHSEVSEFSRLIKSLKAERFSIIVIDHNVKAVKDLVDRIVAIHAGKIIASGIPDEVISNAEVKRVFLGEVQGTAFEKKPLDQENSILLEVNIKSLKYNKAQALRDVDLIVRKGQFVSVVGLNGAGKTSLFRAIFSFVNYEGDVKWQGQSIQHLDTADIVNLGIAFVPETRELFKYMSVEENLSLALQKVEKNEAKNRIEEVYSIFPRLLERKKQSASTLSGGEQQMLTIARALVQKPKMIVLDEPTLGLAPIVLEDISKVLDYMHKQMNLTILLGEQNLHFALKHSDRVYLLEHGSIICECTMEEFKERIGDKYLA